MTTLLHIEASPRKAGSQSVSVATEFANAYRQANPGDTIETLDVWSLALPSFDGETIAAKYRILQGQDQNPAEARAWRTVEDIFAQFNAADKYLFSLPMWNFGIPYRLKHYIDVITQPGLAFSFSPTDGYSGLVTGKPVAVIYTRGGEYSSSPELKALDFQKPYLENWLGFIGFTDMRSIEVDSTLGAPDEAAKAKAAATRRAVELAKAF